jgi:hypothetical protein
MNQFIRVFALILTLAILSACSSSVSQVKLYEGPDLPDSQVATIVDYSTTALSKGNRPSRPIKVGQYKEFDRVAGKVLPGEYEMEVGLWFLRRRLEPAKFRIKVEPGRTYLLHRLALYPPQTSCSFRTNKKRQYFWLEDSTTGEVVGGIRPHQSADDARKEGLEKLKSCKGMTVPLVTPGGATVYGAVSSTRSEYYYADWNKGVKGD